MSFERPLLLVLLLLPLGWLLWEWRHTHRRVALTLKSLALACVILALSEPRITVPETRAAVAVLIDTSASVTKDDLARASALATAIDGGRGRNWTRIIPFAGTVRVPDDSERNRRGWTFKPASGDTGRGTDLEAAVREAVASFPPDAIPRIVLVSDGHENRGSVARAAWLARDLNVPVDTVALKGHPAPSLRLEQVTFPTLAFTGEKFPIDLILNAPKRASGTVELTAEGKAIGTSPIQIEAGQSQIRVHASLNIAGAVDVSGRIRSAELGEVSFKTAIAIRRPRILYVSNDPAGTEANLLEAMQAGQFDVQVSGDVFQNLDEYQLVVLNNQDLENLAAARKAAIEQYVRAGGGLLVIGGERNVYNENKKVEDALDRALPAKLAPPRSQEGTCVVLILDKSSSMEGRKMELARLSAIGVIDNLRPIDLVGVLIFDNSFQWAVPIRKAEDRSTIKRLVAGVMPDGGTQIAPALAEGFRRIQPVQATYKHIVLLTDGISEEGDSMAVSREASTQKVTISTVGLGQDVNRAYLEKIAVNAKGKSYFLVDPSGLEQILLKDVQEHTGAPAVEKPVVPVVVRQSELLSGVGMETAPPLRGYVRFISKPGADTILKFEKDPLYVSWQFGLGRSGIWASDAKSRWAERWIGWDGFDRFWLNVFRDLLPHAQSGEATAHYDEASGKLRVEYRLAPNTPPPARVPEIYALGPEGFRKPLPVQKVAEGVYSGAVAVGGLQGLFRIRPLTETRAFPETGFYREEEELTSYGNNEALLRHVSEFTGGRFNPQPGAVFDTGGRSIPSSVNLWPILLAIAIGLNLTELVMRKWPAIMDTARR